MIIEFLCSCYSILFGGTRLNFRYAHANGHTSAKLLNKWPAAIDVHRKYEMFSRSEHLVSPLPFLKPPTFIKWICLFC